MIHLLEESQRVLNLMKNNDYSATYDTAKFSVITKEIAEIMNETLDVMRKSDEYLMVRFNLVTTALQFGLWDVHIEDDDPNHPGNVYTWTDEMRRLMGFTDERDFPNALSEWASRIHPEDQERTITAYVASVIDRTGRTPYNQEHRLKMKTGEYRWFHTIGSAIRDENGKALRFAGALIDIQAKRFATQAKQTVKQNQDDNNDPVTEPTLPSIMQQSQPKTLEPVRKEADNVTSTISMHDWKKKNSHIKVDRTLQEINKDLQQFRKKLSKQKKAINIIEDQLLTETSNLRKYSDYERRDIDVEERLGYLSRLNPLNWGLIKNLEQSKESLIKDKENDFGEIRREHIEQHIAQLNQEKQSEENKLFDLVTCYNQTKTELKTLKDLDKSRNLLERYKDGEKLTSQETKFINSFSKELNIKKIPISRNASLSAKR